MGLNAAVKRVFLAHRVAERFLRASDAAVTKLLGMISQGKGKSALVNMDLLEKALGELGWSVTSGLGWSALTDRNQIKALLPWPPGEIDGLFGVKQPKEFIFRSQGAAELGKLQLLQLKKKPALELGALHLKEIGQTRLIRNFYDEGEHKFEIPTQGWSVVTPSYEFKAPSGATFGLPLPVDTRGQIGDPARVKIPRFWTWAYKSGLQEAATSYLGQAEATPSPASLRSRENTGTCAVCFKNVKLTTKRRIRHHGWSVQGARGRGQYGGSWQSGACQGTGYPAFEESKEGAQKYLAFLKKMAAEAKRAKNRVSAQRIADEIRGVTARIRSWKPRPLPGSG